jgi:hypothetical protein
MSDMTSCNYCTLRRLQRLGTATVKPAPKTDFPDGVDVLIKWPDQKEPTWAAWFAALPDHCVC